jgi:hypothetical protein
VEHLGEGFHRLVGAVTVEGLEQRAHLRLPAGVDLGGLHAGPGGGEVLGLQVADEQAVVTQEERVVVPAGGGECLAHLRPHRGVAFAVLRDAVLSDLEQETDALHGLPLPYVRD